MREGVERLVRVRALGAQLHCRATLGGEHHHAHDALAVHLEIVAHHGDVSLVLRRELHDLGRRPGVDAILVDHLHRAFRHQRITEERATEYRTKIARTTSARRHPSIRPDSLTISISPMTTASSTPPMSERPGPMTRESASGSATPAANAATRAICCGPRRRTGLPNALATLSP